MSSEKNDSGGSNLHVVFLPFPISSHMIPLVDVARLFAARGVRSTIVTTVHNALIFQSSVNLDIAAGHPLAIHTMNFPSSEVGLPDGTENINACKTEEMTHGLFLGMALLQTQMENLIREIAPNCIFSDMFFPWTVDLADELKIPRLLFHPSGLFYHSVFDSLKVFSAHNDVKLDSESILVPNLPDKITMTRSQVSHHFDPLTEMGEMMGRITQSEKRSYGLVYNTFYEIEPAYVDHCKKVKGSKIWHIGPLFQYFDNKDSVDLEKHFCLKWLDNQKPNSVIYVCFGSMVRFPEAQITEIALALDECKQPFVWVVRKNGDEGIGGIPDGFEERVMRENRGLIITEWAPQVEILQHAAVGGFFTHCGWNSVLEAVVAGVPLVTWPLYADHFYNEKLVELIGIGVGVGAEVWNSFFEINSPIIPKQNIIEGIEKLTSGSESIKRNLKEVTMKARRAVQEGGSSFENLASLIEDIKAFKFVRAKDLIQAT